MQFPGARGTFGEEVRTPQNFLPESAQFFYILRFGRPDPLGEKSQNIFAKKKKSQFFRTFGLGRPLHKFGAENRKNTNSLIETEKRETNHLQLGPNTQS